MWSIKRKYFHLVHISMIDIIYIYMPSNTIFLVIIFNKHLHLYRIATFINY